jgi:outer membrane autotransporter protein
MAWVNYVGRSNSSRSAHNGQDWNLSMAGIQVGTDLYRTRFEQFGILFGYEDGKMTNAADRINANDHYFGLYAACVFLEDVDVRGAFSYGWQRYTMNRWDSGSVYRSSFNGNTMDINFEVGRRLASGSVSLRPIIGLDIASNRLKGGRETGESSDAVIYHKTDLTQIFIRTGTEVRYRMPAATLTGGLYYAYDLNGASLATTVTDVTRQQPFQLRGTKPGRSLWLFNFGGTFHVTDSLAIIGGYQGECATDNSGSGVHSTGYIGGSWRW